MLCAAIRSVVGPQEFEALQECAPCEAWTLEHRRHLLKTDRSPPSLDAAWLKSAAQEAQEVSSRRFRAIRPVPDPNPHAQHPDHAEEWWRLAGVTSGGTYLSWWLWRHTLDTKDNRHHAYTVVFRVGDRHTVQHWKSGWGFVRHQGKPFSFVRYYAAQGVETVPSPSAHVFPLRFCWDLPGFFVRLRLDHAKPKCMRFSHGGLAWEEATGRGQKRYVYPLVTGAGTCGDPDHPQHVTFRGSWAHGWGTTLRPLTPFPTMTWHLSHEWQVLAFGPAAGVQLVHPDGRLLRARRVSWHPPRWDLGQKQAGLARGARFDLKWRYQPLPQVRLRWGGRVTVRSARIEVRGRWEGQEVQGTGWTDVFLVPTPPSTQE